MATIVDALIQVVSGDFIVPPDGNCAALLDKPCAFKISNICIDGKYNIDDTIKEAEENFTSRVSPCEICGKDTYLDIVVGWACLYDGANFINGIRLCDECSRQAVKEALPSDIPPYIEKLTLIHRVNDKGRVSPDDEWRKLTTTHCGMLNKI